MGDLIKLRPYQQEAFDSVMAKWDAGSNKLLLVLPTGTGKTIVFSAVANECVKRGSRVLIMAHRGELLNQAADKLRKSTGLGCAIEKADETCMGSWFRVTAGSVQSLMQDNRLRKFAPDYFGTIIIDEAHHSISDSYQKVLRHFPEAKVLGVTATPDRGDMRDLGTYYEEIAYEYTLPQAIREKFLCPIRALTIPLKLDISNVGVSAGDFKAGEIGTALDPYLEQIAAEMEKYCMQKKTVVFLPLIKTSQKFRDILNHHGFHAAEVNGNSDDRAEVLKDFDSGRYNVLCNSMLLTEGWDCPTVDCIIVLRPTKVRALYSQMVGRGTRLSEGKDHLLLLDFLWMTDKHDLCHPASLICDDEEVAKQMTKDMAEKPGEDFDIEAAEEVASEEVTREREEALAKLLTEQRRKKSRLVDPLQFEMSIQDMDLKNYVPTFGWAMQTPTEYQKKDLEKLQINPEGVECAGKAELLIEKARQRIKDNMATPRQIRQLEQRGFVNVGEWSFEQARRLIDRIAGNGWRTPWDIVPEAYKPPEIKNDNTMTW